MHIRQRAECFTKYFPGLEKEWSEKNTEDINNFSRSSPYTAIWRCSVCGYEWSAQIVSRCTGCGGCPQCREKMNIERNKEGGKIVSFLVHHPDLELDWSDKNIILPSNVDAYSKEKVIWKCHICGWEWISQVSTRCAGDAKCPNCRKKKKDK